MTPRNRLAGEPRRQAGSGVWPRENFEPAGAAISIRTPPFFPARKSKDALDQFGLFAHAHQPEMARRHLAGARSPVRRRRRAGSGRRRNRRKAAGSRCAHWRAVRHCAGLPPRSGKASRRRRRSPGAPGSSISASAWTPVRSAKREASASSAAPRPWASMVWPRKSPSAARARARPSRTARSAWVSSSSRRGDGVGAGDLADQAQLGRKRHQRLDQRVVQIVGDAQALAHDGGAARFVVAARRLGAQPAQVGDVAAQGLEFGPDSPGPVLSPTQCTLHQIQIGSRSGSFSSCSNEASPRGARRARQLSSPPGAPSTSSIARPSSRRSSSPSNAQAKALTKVIRKSVERRKTKSLALRQCRNRAPPVRGSCARRRRPVRRSAAPRASRARTGVRHRARRGRNWRKPENGPTRRHAELKPKRARRRPAAGAGQAGPAPRGAPGAMRRIPAPWRKTPETCQPARRRGNPIHQRADALDHAQGGVEPGVAENAAGQSESQIGIGHVRNLGIPVRLCPACRRVQGVGFAGLEDAGEPDMSNRFRKSVGSAIWTNSLILSGDPLALTLSVRTLGSATKRSSSLATTAMAGAPENSSGAWAMMARQSSLTASASCPG